MTASHADEGSGPIRAAREALRVERRRVVDEREAFRAFRDRASSISGGGVGAGSGGGAASVPDRPGGAGGAVRDARRKPAASGSRLVAVREAYRATVMSVPHYEAEYDDTYERSVAEEFGPELAYALTRTPGLSTECRESLLAATETAIQEREAFLDALEAEAGSVERARSRLAPVRSEIGAIADEVGGDGGEIDLAVGFGALDACRVRTESLADDCDRIAARRQRVLADHDRRLALGDEIDLPTYCYQDLGVDYPVLAAVGAVGDRLDRLRRRIERAMARSA